MVKIKSLGPLTHDIISIQRYIIGKNTALSMFRIEFDPCYLAEEKYDLIQQIEWNNEILLGTECAISMFLFLVDFSSNQSTWENSFRFGVIT